ncbi:MAG: glycosyltransferase [Deltaproteobacteria bacterium]|nr:glycosyltransferase [Deltaproteobacteria bacterium]
MRKPLVSVVIPVYNRARRLSAAVASVLDQTWKNLEIIVVDDGSGDGGADRIRREFGGRVKILALPRNRGVSYARNRGFELSRGAFVAFLDSDDLWRPEKTARQVAWMQERPELLISQTDEIWIRNGRRVNPCRHHRKPSGRIFSACLPLCVVSPSAVMMRRRFFAEVGLFDERLPACEDYDLWLRAACRFPVGLLPEPLVIKHGGHADQLSRTVPALDRYRIRSLIKLLSTSLLTPSQSVEARAILERKCRIYLNGCRKRGRLDEVRRLELEIERLGVRPEDC